MIKSSQRPKYAEALIEAAGKYQLEKNYWHDLLAGGAMNTSIPCDHLEKSGKDISLDEMEFDVPGTVAVKLLEMSKRSPHTMHVLLLAGLAVLLRKYTGAEDIVVGSTIYRLEENLDFSNTVLPLVASITGDLTFKELVLQMRRRVQEAIEHYRYPMEILGRDLDCLDANGAPTFFDVGLLVENIQNRDHLSPTRPNVVFTFCSKDSSITGKVEYNREMYLKTTICRAVEFLFNSLSQALFNPQLPIDSIELISEEEKLRLAEELNRTATPLPDHPSIWHWFDRTARTCPHNIAVVGPEGSGSVTYDTLAKKADNTARLLKRHGAGPGAIVGLLTEPSLDMMTGLLGILRSGAAFLPLDPRFPQGRVEFMLKDSDTSSLLVQPDLEQIPTFDGPVFFLDDGAHQEEDIPGNLQFPDITPQDLLYVIYTSGTTGKPKGVQLLNQNLLNYVGWFCRAASLSQADRTMLVSSFAFDLGYTAVWPSLLSGAQLHLAPKDHFLEADILLNYILTHAVTYLKMTPSLFSIIIGSGLFADGAFRRLRLLVLGGEAMNLDDVRTAREYYPGLSVMNHYGPTEATIGCIAHIIDFQRFESYIATPVIGSPIDNMRVFIVDRQNPRHLLPIGMPGELCLAGEGLARGYLNRPETTNEKFPLGLMESNQRMYHTGDLARRLEDGSVQFMGRIDHQVKIRGFRIELEEIENRLQALDAVMETAVVVRRDKGGDPYLCAYLVWKDVALDTATLREVLAKDLPDYMIPPFFVSIERLPLTANNKLDRDALPEPAIDAAGQYLAPSNMREHALVKLWAEVLGRDPEQISVDANFFSLGGQSLKATVLAGKIQKEFNVNIPLIELFKAPTLAGQALYIGNRGQELHQRINPVEKRDYYPLSPAQKRLLILQHMEPSSTAYNRPRIVYLEEGTNLSRLEEVLRQLVQRHESLRTSFHWVNDEPVQRIHSDAELNVDHRVDLEMADFVKPFDLSIAPLARVILVKGADGTAMLVVDMHHIIADGVSQDILVRDFATLSEGLPLPPLGIQYKDFAVWQGEDSQQETMARQESYWLERFTGDIPELELPLDFPRPTIQSFEGRTVDFMIGKSTTDALSRLATNGDSTLFMVLLGIFNVLLHRLTGQEDIIVGAPIAGRRHIDLQGILGMFVNTLVMRNRCLGSDSFSQFLSSVRNHTIDAFDNQDYPFEDLVEKLSIRRDASRNPLFDVAFNFLNYLSPSGQTADRTGASEDDNQSPADRVAKFDLIFATVEREEGLWFQVQYCTKLFKSATIERFMRYFQQLAHALANDPSIAMGHVDMIPAQEKRQLLYDFNDTAREYPDHPAIHHLVEETASNHPHAVALGAANDTGGDSVHQFITYRELDRWASGVAVDLVDRGIAPGSIVAVLIDASLDLMAAILGILKAGSAYLPLDPDYPEERIRFMLDDSAAALLLEAAASPTDISSQTLPPQSHGGDMAYVIYTSGSTGRPKGVAIQHQSLVNLCCWHNRRFEVTGLDRAAKYAGLGFDASVWEIFPYLVAGSSLYVVPHGIRTDIGRLNKFFEINHITIAFLPTQVAEQFMKLDNKSLRTLLTGGDALREYHRPPYRLENNYGPTENTVVTTCFTVERQARNIPIGTPLDNCRVYILDSNRNLQPLGVPGELCVAGAGLARGYLNRPDLTHDCFLTHGSLPDARLYKTGDRCRVLENGNIEFLGRIDQQVKIRGFRIELREIESVLLESGMVSGAAVTVKRSADGDKTLVAYVVAADEGNPPDIPAVKKSLGQNLPVYMIPPYFVTVSSIPLTANGKVDFDQLPEPDIQLEAEIVPPENERERQLAALWAEVLNLDEERIGVTANFFELGGHSLKATVLVTRIHRDFGVEIPLVEVFRAPTIRNMALAIEQSRRERGMAVPLLEKKDYYHLSSAQKRLFALQQLNLQSTVYNIPQVITLPGAIDEVVLRNVLNQIIGRHESLRTSFTTVDQEPVQRALDTVSWDLETFTLDPARPQESGQQIFQSFFRPFDLSCAPLVRMGFLRTHDGRNYLLTDMHHIISDGASMDILAREFRALYSGESLLPLTVQYKDYAGWQRQRQQTEAHRRHLDYWLEQFSGGVPLLELPVDYSRPPIRSFSGDLIGFKLDRDLTRRLEELASQRGATLFMTLLAIFNVFLSRLSGQEDIVVGTPVAGRVHADLHSIIGMFVNTLALRNFPKMELPFAKFLDQLRNRAIDAFDHQEVQFDDLVECLNVPRDVSRNPVFDVMMTLQNTGGGTEQRTETDREGQGPFGRGKRNSRFDMSWTFVAREDGLEVAIEYCDHLFAKSTMQRFAGYFQVLAQAVANDPSILIQDIDIIPSEERACILERFNGARKDYPLKDSIPAFIRRQAERRPHQIIAVDDGDSGGNRQVTFRELRRRARSLARILRNHGAVNETIIAIFMERSLETLLSIVGALEAGGAYLPLDTEAPEERNLFIMKDSRASLLVASKPGTQDFAAIRRSLPDVTVVDAEAEATWAGKRFSASIEPSSKDLAYVIYTSGTTGKPKGVLVEHRNAVNLCHALHENVHRRFHGALRLALLSPFVFDASVQQTFGALLFSHCLVIVPKSVRSNGEALIHYFNRHCVDVSDGTPAHVSLLAEAAPVAGLLTTVKCVVAGGDVLSKSVAAAFFSAFHTSDSDPMLFNVYGPTECTVNCTMMPVNGTTISLGERIPIGKPMDNYRTYILDKQLRPVPTGVVGELFIAGEGVARGYLNRSKLTAQRFLPDPYNRGQRMYRSGDLGRFLADGAIDFLGRVDSQVKLRGYRIELGEIENCLRKYPLVSGAVAALKMDHQGERCLCAYLVPAPGEEIDIDGIREFLRQYVPFYMIPSYITVISSIPMTPNNKVDRKALPEPDISMPAYVAPGNDLERGLSEIWAGVLGLDEQTISVTADFFQIGGHSIRATTLVARVHRRWGFNLPLVEVFRHSTIRSMAAYLDNQKSSARQANDSGIVPLREQGSQQANIFSIHDGSGHVDGYASLLSHAQFPVNGWGIVAPSLEELTPQDWTVESIAASYIKQIDEMDLPAPYHLMGWSLGGTIVFEMARQLQARPGDCGVVLLVDAPGPRPEEGRDIGQFSLETETGLLRDYFPQLLVEERLNADAQLKDFWPLVASMLEEAGVEAGDIVRVMPPAIAQLFSQRQMITIPQLLHALNVNRSLARARSLYVPDSHLKSSLHVIEARDSDIESSKEWQPYCRLPVGRTVIDGDHFSIMSEPAVGSVVRVLRELLLKRPE